MDLQEIRKEMVKHADVERAWHSKSYLKSEDKFHGVRLPVVRGVAKEFYKDNRDVPLFELYPLLDSLWNSNYHEEKNLAIFILALYKKQFDESTWDLTSSWLDGVAGWDTCDGISSWILGIILSEDKTKTKELIDWTKSKNFWRRRAAAVSLLPVVRKQCNVDVVLKICTPMMEDKERFVQMGVGWVLREAASVDMARIFAFLSSYKNKSGRWLLRYATEKMPAVKRKAILGI